ncbi:effector binding domain-containing protein [Bacillus sp. FJAT-50079]|uniref:GyrI-like domain-containing protein n=1 Tax=Bacillus sp. FJAT-50079 TaxID=2833577 RepID=UPI001BC9504C|nr:effector binding domain-containing protein [Bacillus sp. FJAT-50079]MBS4209929.1 effector binding domain-containing protein [Bacillus sp. FJAT-50079]
MQDIKNKNIVKAAFAKLKSQLSEFPNRVGDHLYLVQIYPMKERFDPKVDKFISLVGYEILDEENRPPNTVVHIVPENFYAFYSFKDIEANIQLAYDYLYGHWLQEQGYDSLGYDLELWDERYKPEESANEIDMFIAIKKQ